MAHAVLAFALSADRLAHGPLLSSSSSLLATPCPQKAAAAEPTRAEPGHRGVGQGSCHVLPVAQVLARRRTESG